MSTGLVQGPVKRFGAEVWIPFAAPLTLKAGLTAL